MWYLRSIRARPGFFFAKPRLDPCSATILKIYPMQFILQLMSLLEQEKGSSFKKFHNSVTKL